MDVDLIASKKAISCHRYHLILFYLVLFIHLFVFFRYISVSSAQLFISYIHLTSSNESETGRGLLFLSAATLFHNVFFVFLEINLANSICLFFFSFATAILLFIVLNAQTPDWVILLCGFRYGPPWLLSLMRDVIPKQDGSGLILYIYIYKQIRHCLNNSNRIVFEQKLMGSYELYVTTFFQQKSGHPSSLLEMHRKAL